MKDLKTTLVHIILGDWASMLKDVKIDGEYGIHAADCAVVKRNIKFLSKPVRVNNTCDVRLQIAGIFDEEQLEVCESDGLEFIPQDIEMIDVAPCVKKALAGSPAKAEVVTADVARLEKELRELITPNMMADAWDIIVRFVRELIESDTKVKFTDEEVNQVIRNLQADIPSFMTIG